MSKRRPAAVSKAAKTRPAGDHGERAAAGNKAAVNVLAALTTFIGRDRRLTIAGLSRELGMTRNMAHRALHTLAEQGLLIAEKNGEFAVGFRALGWTVGAADDFDLVALCRPFLEELSRLSGESALLSTIVGRSRVNIDWIHAAGPRVTHVQQGRAVPLHFLGNSRCLLAFLSDGDIRDYIATAAPLDQWIETPDADPDELLSDLAAIRKQGYALWQGTSGYKAAFVTWPVLDQSGHPHAAITVGGPLDRFDRARALAFVELGQPIVERLNRQSSMYAAAPVFMTGKRPHGTRIMNSSAARTLQILNIIGDSTVPIGLSQIARELGGPLSNVARGIEALERTGFIQRYQASARYVLGEAAKNLRQSAIGRFRLRDLALPYLRQLAFASGETSTLVVRVGWFAVRIASVAGPNEAVSPLPSAMAEPILKNAGGRAIIAMESSEFANRLLDGLAPKDAATQRREFSAIRKRGFAISATPLAPGYAALAFPVMGDAGPVGAIHLEGPVCRSADLEPRDEVERWKGIVAEISEIVRDRPDMGINPFGEIDARSVELKID